MKNLLIIGGTSGFGLVFGRVLSQHYSVTITGRREILESNLQSVILDSSNIDINWLRDHAPQIIINNGYDKKNHLASFDNSLKVVRESIKYFKEIGGGVLVNINSISGLIPDVKDPDYAASKHGLKGYVDSVSYDAFLNNINIINLYPRAISTGMNEGREDFSKLIHPQELADFCLLLLKTKSFYVSTIVFDRVFSYDSDLPL
jgi:short-subunit dehydrogenase